MITIKNMLRLGRAFNSLYFMTSLSPLLTIPNYSFAFMQLFERHKTKAELDPVFKRETKMKGHLKSRSSKHHSTKLNTLSVRKPKQKLKNHKGLLKRIKIVFFRVLRSDLVGIGSSNSNLLERATCEETRAEPTWWERDRHVTCIRLTCLRSKSWFHILRESHWKWGIEVNWLVYSSNIFLTIYACCRL